MDAIDASIASSQTRKGASSQESLDDKNDICLRGIFKIPPLAPRPVAGNHTFALPFYQYQFQPPAKHCEKHVKKLSLSLPVSGRGHR
jgi:hypothetical protein